jgi:hypothetical protein
MKSVLAIRNSFPKATLTAAVLLALAFSARPAAAETASTDIYRNEFQQSFGAPVRSPASLKSVTQVSGSTDLWATDFRTAFGRSAGGSVSRASTINGSTDTWGNGFHASFEDPAQPASPAHAQSEVTLR